MGNNEDKTNPNWLPSKIGGLIVQFGMDNQIPTIDIICAAGAAYMTLGQYAGIKSEDLIEGLVAADEEIKTEDPTDSGE